MFARIVSIALPLAGLLACWSDDPNVAPLDAGSDVAVTPVEGGKGDGDGGNVTPSSCNAGNCTGCCLNGTCQTGITAAGCGKNGQTCAVCSGKQICKTDQACGVDPESMWTVHPASATVATKNGAADWDVGGGAPDPYVSLWCPPSAATPVVTPTVNDSFNPVWPTGGCTVKAKDLLSTGFAIQVFDADIANPDPIGTKRTIVPNESELLAGNTNVSGAPLTTLRIELSQQ